MAKSELYRNVLVQTQALCEGEPSLIANLSNISAILFDQLTDINWVGFYLTQDNVRGDEKELVLGPFQGKPACVRIPVGRGVCGTAVATASSMVVEDVHQFDGHIACDAASNSEIVLPIINNNEVVAVLDIDSPSLSRFDKEDLAGLTKLKEFIEGIWC